MKDLKFWVAIATAMIAWIYWRSKCPSNKRYNPISGKCVPSVGAMIWG